MCECIYEPCDHQPQVVQMRLNIKFTWIVIPTLLGCNLISTFPLPLLKLLVTKFMSSSKSSNDISARSDLEHFPARDIIQATHVPDIPCDSCDSWHAWHQKKEAKSFSIRSCILDLKDSTKSKLEFAMYCSAHSFLSFLFMVRHRWRTSFVSLSIVCRMRFMALSCFFWDSALTATNHEGALGWTDSIAHIAHIAFAKRWCDQIWSR